MASSATQFRTGRSGNPRGRKPGLLLSTVNRQLRKAAQQQLAGKAAAIVANAVELAAAGDPGCIAAVIGLMVAVIEPAKPLGGAPATNSPGRSAD